jgi:hypothetical protein
MALYFIFLIEHNSSSSLAIEMSSGLKFSLSNLQASTITTKHCMKIKIVQTLETIILATESVAGRG